MKFPLSFIYNLYRQAIRNPNYRWWVIIGTLIYILSPFDIAPDFIPIAGQMDDLVILTMFFTEVSQLVFSAFKNEPPTLTKDNPTNTEKTIDVDAVSLD
jgi:uncharacterized membrane protein YkvA (DUF1232 family)